MNEVDAAPMIHPRKFHHPANQPQLRPYRPAATVAQWYTVGENDQHDIENRRMGGLLSDEPLLDEGIADANSAIEAAMNM